MDIRDFEMGANRKGFQYSYFLPEKISLCFVWTNEAINELLESVPLKLGELNSVSKFGPDTDHLIITHIIKESITSGGIEGTKTNIEEALADEKDINPERHDDWKEENNYLSRINLQWETWPK
ncbi:MAG: hypothetical protein LWX56_13775 [Ignavibacteria bacterium]|nr:hypothetical protein [Ignavibacteria bacterium]